MRILLVEDHALVRQATRHYLQAEGFAIVGEAANGHEALTLAYTTQPDLIVMDVQMPGMNGIEATRMIRQQLPTVRILILSAHAEAAYVRALQEAGAHGYLLKTASLTELVTAIQAVLAGERLFDMQTPSAMDHPQQVSEREIEVLQWAQQGDTNKQIGYHMGISDRTVQQHLSNIYRKLGVTSRTEAVTVALTQGILRLDDR